MDVFKWGIAGPAHKMAQFAADLPFAQNRHRLVAATGDHPPAELGVTVYDDLQQLLQSDIDAVYLATPAHQHYSEVQQCLLQRKAVLCERPIAANARELDVLISLSDQCRTFMMEAAWIRFVPSVKKLLSVLDNGTLGAVVSVRVSVYYQNRENELAGLPESDSVLDIMGPYPAFLCTLLLGTPSIVQASAKGRPGGETSFTAFLSYDEGQYAYVEATAVLPGESEVIIHCEHGTIRVRSPWTSKPEGIEVAYHDGTKLLHRSSWEGRGLHFELDEVCEALQSGSIESPLYAHQFMRDVRETLDMIREQLV